MFRITFITIGLLSSLSLFAQTGKNSSISFQVVGPKESAVRLFKVNNGMAESLGFQRPDVDGHCTFQLDEPKEGIYYFAKAGGKGSDFRYVLYLKKGDHKQVQLFLDKYSVDYDSCVIEKPNTETKIMQSWLNEVNSYSTAVKGKQDESYAKYKSFSNQAVQFLKKNKTKNTVFNSILSDKIGTELLYLRAANFFHFNKRLNSAYDSSAVVQDFYKPLLEKSIVSNPALLQSEHGQQLLNFVFAFWQFNTDKDGSKLPISAFSNNVPFIKNDKVKVAYLLQKLPPITKYEDFVHQVEPYKQYFVTEKEKAAYQKKYEDLYLYANGTRGYNFSLQDVHNNTYTLDSFKGKVLIIDMWAMWCAPCLAEKPIMEHLAEGYKDRNDIAFVGVSVDGLNRREIWKDFVKKKGFTTIELLSNATESIQQYYKIEGIPRFLIFDREGKIITVDAPRPSNPGFKKIIDEALAGK